MKLTEVDLRNIYRVWKKGLGPYRCFFRSSAFVSLKTYDDFEIADFFEKPNEKILESILKESIEKNFIIVDLNFDEILDIALQINNEENIKPILNINLLFHPYGIIGTRDNISRLINYAGKIKDIKTKKFVMFVPYDRYDEKIDVSNVYDKLNNQYALGLDDLPTADFLRQLGYNGISIITKVNIKEDIKDYVEYISKDFKVNLVKVNK
ncbi:MAG: normocyte-binding protein [Clostridium butyricum]|nr:normocyte-binding protein [Clostridium butyricum]